MPALETVTCEDASTHSAVTGNVWPDGQSVEGLTRPPIHRTALTATSL
jgi:hypothetical protein